MNHYTVRPKDKTLGDLEFCKNSSQERIIKNVMYTPKADRNQLLRSVFYDKDKLTRNLNELIDRGILARNSDSGYYYLKLS